MKLFIFLINITLFIFCGNAYGQQVKRIPSIPLMVSTNETTNLIFPFSIESVDIGSSDLLAQKANGIENILQIKAARENFDQTNLSVVTSEGKFYSFLINYSANPLLLNLQFQNSSVDSESSIAVNFQSLKSNQAKVEIDAKNVLNKKRSLFGVKYKSNGMLLLLSGLYIDNDVLYFKVEVHNNTNIKYDFESLNFFIKDIKQSKRTAVQEIPQIPLLVFNDSGFVKGKTNLSFVVALPKFTIPDKKMLLIQLMEKNGGRNLSLKIKNRTLVKAETISSTN